MILTALILSRSVTYQLYKKKLSFYLSMFPGLTQDYIVMSWPGNDDLVNLKVFPWGDDCH